MVDQDECPTVTERINPDSEEKRTFLHPTKIGRKAWERIRNDRLLTVRPVGDAPAEAVTLQANLSDALAKLADANERVASNEARAGLAEREVVKLGEALTAANQSVDELHEAFKAAQDKIAELEAQLQVASERAELAEDAAGRLTIERDESMKQLEQLTAPSPSEDTPPAPAAQPKSKQAKANKGGG